MFCGLREEERTRFTEKNFVAVKRGLVGMKEYFKTCTIM